MLDGIVVVVFPSHPPPHLRDVATVAAAMSLRLLVLWLVVVLLVLGLLLLKPTPPLARTRNWLSPVETKSLRPRSAHTKVPASPRLSPERATSRQPTPGAPLSEPGRTFALFPAANE